jgi:hypothetical protein
MYIWVLYFFKKSKINNNFKEFSLFDQKVRYKLELAYSENMGKFLGINLNKIKVIIFFINNNFNILRYSIFFQKNERISLTI